MSNEVLIKGNHEGDFKDVNLDRYGSVVITNNHANHFDTFASALIATGATFINAPIIVNEYIVITDFAFIGSQATIITLYDGTTTSECFRLDCEANKTNSIQLVSPLKLTANYPLKVTTSNTAASLFVSGHVTS